MEEAKAKSKSVSFLPDLWEKVEAKAGLDYAGNRSSYLRELVEADLKGDNGRSMMSETILVDLTRRLLGELDAAEMAESMKGIDQRRKLSLVLEDLLAAEYDLHADGAHLESDERLYNLAGENAVNAARRRKRRGVLAKQKNDQYGVPAPAHLQSSQPIQKRKHG